MSERKRLPILFTPAMVLAILDGVKTVTRRVVKPQELVKQLGAGIMAVCPYGAEGDELYVRETHWRYGRWLTRGDGSRTFLPYYPDDLPVVEQRRGVHFEPGGPQLALSPPADMGWHKRPSIFLPGWASRIELRRTYTTLERLQRITREDALREGVTEDPLVWKLGEDAHNALRAEIYERYGEPCGDVKCADATSVFFHLWDTINEARGYAVESNPWVWVVGFTVARVRNWRNVA